MAPSHFIFDMLSPISSKPVIYVPVAVSANIEKHYGRGYFGLPEKKILFLCYYDFHSFMHRKNPEGAIKAFLEAFPDKENAVELIIKTINGAKHPQQYIELLEMAQTDRRIHVINKTMLRNEMLNLINNCDSLVSLHRAEGFGLGLAEAMLLGKPVIATGYSGNMDFMNSENSCVVDYNLIPVEEDYYPFWPGQHWAEPDCQQAAMYMKKLYEDVEYRQNIAEKGQAWIREKHSPTKVGEIMRDRLNEISKI
jgi:glycosyltransferase involved in cell wall biosynthesis